MIVARKASGIPCESAGGRKGVTEKVAAILRVPAGRLSVVTPLDRDAWGLVLIARTPSAARDLAKQMKSRRAVRRYSAVVEGDAGEGTTRTVRTHLAMSRRGVPEPVDPARAHTEYPVEAIIHVRTKQRGDTRSLVHVRAETDRPMEVRAQLAEAEMPVVNDRAFGAQAAPLKGVALVADEIVVPGAKETDRARTFRVDLPRDVRALMDADKIASAGDEAGAMETAEGERVAVGWEQRGWEQVAPWYAELLGERGSDFHEVVVHPGVMRLARVEPGSALLDLACGEGTLCRLAAQAGAEVFGLDASASLVERARDASPERAEFVVGDARAADLNNALAGRSFDAVTCVMALMNIDDAHAVVRGASSLLSPGGRLVIVVLHPAFRTPGQTAWGWTPDGDRVTQFRRVDSYLGETAQTVVMNPGAVAQGEPAVETTTYHRPLSAYTDAVSSAGLLIDAVEEWASHRSSDSGPRAAEENRARREIPMFLAIRAIKPGQGAGIDEADDEADELGAGFEAEPAPRRGAPPVDDLGVIG